MSESLNVYQRINEVRKLVDYIKKDKKVESYMAVTHDAVTALAREHLIKYGIVIVPSQIAGTSLDTGTKTQKGTPIIRYEATYDFRFQNIDDPNDFFVSAGIQAHANDTGDKAPGKALSYAKKAVMLKIFEIETGENDESRVEGVRFMMDAEIQMFITGLKEATSPEERARLWKMAAQACRDVEDMEAYKKIKDVAESLANEKAVEPPEGKGVKVTA